MKEARLSEWLHGEDKNQKTILCRISNCKKVERYGGNRDATSDQDVSAVPARDKTPEMATERSTADNANAIKAMPDARFKRKMASAGKTFLGLKLAELIASGSYESDSIRTHMTEELYDNQDGWEDRELSGTQTRVSCAVAIINAGRTVDALEAVLTADCRVSDQAKTKARQTLADINSGTLRLPKSTLEVIPRSQESLPERTKRAKGEPIRDEGRYGYTSSWHCICPTPKTSGRRRHH